MTNTGGANDKGTLFSVTVSGHERILHSFKGRPDGAGPIGSLVLLSGKLWLNRVWRARIRDDFQPEGLACSASSSG